MKKIPILFLFIFLKTNNYAQQAMQWQKLVTSPVTQAYDIQITNDGGFITIAGDVMNLSKFDSIGTLVWSNFYFPNMQSTAGASVKQTNDSGYIAVGGILDNAGYPAVYVVKTDGNGNVLWSRAVGGTSTNYGSSGNSVVQNNSGNFIIAGGTLEIGAGWDDIYLVHIDNNGNVSSKNSIGGVGSEDCVFINQTNDGGYILTGSTTSFGAGNHDIYLIKTDAGGIPVWSKTYGGTGEDYGNSVQQTQDSGYIVCGYTQSFGASYDDIFLFKTNANGDTVWSKTYGVANSYEQGFSVQQTFDNGYILTGYTLQAGTGISYAFLIKTDSLGDTIWTKNYGANSNSHYRGFSVQQSKDSGYVVCGFGDNYDLFFLKTDKNGNSGCNEYNYPFVITSVQPVLTIPSWSYSSGGYDITLSTGAFITFATETTFCSNVGINEITSDNSLLIFPNPSRTNFTITFNHFIYKGELKIYNVLGKNIFSEKINNELKKEVNHNIVSEGIYLVRVFDGEKSYCKKLIVE